MDLAEAYLQALNGSHEGIALFDAALRLVVWNDAYAKMSDMPREVLRRGAPLVELLRFQADRGDFDPLPRNQAVTDLLAGVANHDINAYEIRRSGDRFLELRRRFLPTGGFVASIQEITERRRGEQALVDELRQHAATAASLRSALATAEEARNATSIATAGFHEAVDAILEGVAMYDAHDRLVLWNRHYEDLFPAVAPSLAVGRRFEDICRVFLEKGLITEAKGREEAWLAERLVTHANPQWSFERLTHTGRWVLMRERRTPGGGCVMAFIDITDIKSREAELAKARDRAEAANRAKSEFLTNMSHELRTPLTAIMGFSDIIANGKRGPGHVAAYREYGRHIYDAGAHLLQVVSDILDWSQVEADGLDLKIEPVDFAALVHEVAKMMTGEAAKMSVELVVDLAEDAPRVMADVVRLRQALLNLVSNAIKFTPAGGTAALATSFDRALGRVAVTIADSGIGISEEDIERVFQPFGQAESALSRHYQGVGLGLPLARRFIEAMAGNFSLVSEVGRGTTVTLDLPATA
jgi:two-component system cell cycle sensor histidine kinase PleC